MADDFFTNDDPFDSLVRQFFGQGPGRKAGSRVQRQASYSSSDDLSSGEVIEYDGRIFIIFEIPGFSSNDVKVTSKENVMEIQAKRKSVEGVQPYLSSKLQSGIVIRRELPQGASRKFKYNYKNGILEVVFDK